MVGRQQAFGIRSAVVTVGRVEEFLRQLRSIGQEHYTVIICFNADNMAGLRHAEVALAQAVRSFHGGSPIGKTIEMEALLYAAGTRQCSEAAAFGIQEGQNRIYLCCCPPGPEIIDALRSLVQYVDDTYDCLEADRAARLRLHFSISEGELVAAGGEARLQDLVIERVALINAYR